MQETNINTNETACTEPEVLNFAPRVFTLNELTAMPLPPTEWLLSPLIPQKGISMIAAPRGAGKSFLAMAIAVATASGFGFLNFTAERPRRVLYIDGEMSGRTLQDRFNAISAGFESDGHTVIRENLLIYGCDFQGENPMPDFANETSQQNFERMLQDIGGVDLIIIDNVFTLYGCDDENNASNWQAFNRWSIEQRKRNRSILWIHHTGKKVDNGGRGSSAIETLMDSSLLLSRPQGYNSSEGAVIVGKYVKSRSVAGDAVADFIAQLTGNKDNLQWVFGKAKADKTLQHIKDMRESGCTIEKISHETGIPTASVHRKIQKAGIKKGAAVKPATADTLATPVLKKESPPANLFDGMVHEVDLSQIPDDFPF